MTTDAASDVESILTDMSDEFMVVPVPPCFDPDAPLTADPSPVTVSITEYKQMTESQQGAFSFTLSNQPTLEAEIKRVPGSSSFIDPEGVSSVDTSLEMTSRTTVEEENHVPDLVEETIPQLPDPPISEPGSESPITLEAAPRDLPCDPTEPESPIITEPVNLPAPEPASQSDDPSDDNDDDDDNNDGDDDRSDDDTEEPVVPEVTVQPIAAQPVSSIDEPAPVALQPEPSTPVVILVFGIW